MACECQTECTCVVTGNAASGVTVVGDGSVGTPFDVAIDATVTESTFAAVAGSAAIGITPGGVNGHTPTYDLVLDPASNGASITGSGLLVSAASPQLVTSLPTSPVDGQEVYLQDAAMAAVGVLWRMRYNAASPNAQKWEYAGGSLFSDEVTTGENTTSSPWVDLATVGPQLVLPATGVYRARIGYRAHRSAGGGTSARSAEAGLNIAGVDPLGGQFVRAALDDLSGTFDHFDVPSRVFEFSGVLGDTVKVVYRSSGGADITFYDRHVEIEPLRLA